MKVLIATAMYPTPENPAFGSFVHTQVESLRQFGLQVELLVLRGRNRKLIYPKGIFQLRDLIRDGSVDVVHAHYGLVGMVARTQWKVPVVVTYHGDDLLGTVKENGKTSWISQRIANAGKRLGRAVDAVIVQSEQMAAKLKRANVYVIPHEVNFELFQPVDKAQARSILGLSNEKRYLLFAANPAIPVKRFPFAKAVADSMQRTDPSIELLTVYKETQKRLSLYMSACDALIFPSYQEGSPNVVKQAMACNLPIVATDVGDVRELITNARHCFVTSANVGDFVERLHQILHHCERSDGRNHIGHLDASTVARQVVGVYQNVIASG